MGREVEVAAYYFPNYHVDARNVKWHGSGWTEWDLVKRAEPRFAGHAQPRVPLWGYEDESDPAAMGRKIDAAADHGLDAFIFDWYWYEDGPYLQRGLEDGFLRAGNGARMKFALMWANHDWVDIHPATRSRPFKQLLPGRISLKGFEAATEHVIRSYFSRENYWRIGGRPYFSIYELMTLMDGLGGLDETRRALDGFRERTAKAGLGELHFNAVVWGVKILPNERSIQNPVELLGRLGIDSVTSYVWIHHQPLKQFPQTPYTEIAAASAQDWTRFREQYPLPYYPNVTMGWDASPRTVQSDAFENLGYPWMAMLKGNTPAAFGDACRAARAFVMNGPAERRIVTINAWNEWTEGSYLEPDTEYGFGYLEALREAFGAKGA